MTDLHGPQRQALKERRQQALYFITIIVVVVLSMGLGWMSSVSGREAWKQQAETWQSKYLSLYDEFIREVGEEPDALSPDQVPPDASAARPGPQGQEGPRGPAGPMCPDNYVAQELVLQDERTALVCIHIPVR